MMVAEEKVILSELGRNLTLKVMEGTTKRKKEDRK